MAQLSNFTLSSRSFHKRQRQHCYLLLSFPIYSPKASNLRSRYELNDSVHRTFVQHSRPLVFKVSQQLLTRFVEHFFTVRPLSKLLWLRLTRTVVSDWTHWEKHSLTRTRSLRRTLSWVLNESSARTLAPSICAPFFIVLALHSCGFFKVNSQVINYY